MRQINTRCGKATGKSGILILIHLQDLIQIHFWHNCAPSTVGVKIMQSKAWDQNIIITVLSYNKWYNVEGKMARRFQVDWDLQIFAVVMTVPYWSSNSRWSTFAPLFAKIIQDDEISLNNYCFWDIRIWLIIIGEIPRKLDHVGKMSFCGNGWWTVGHHLQPWWVLYINCYFCEVALHFYNFSLNTLGSLTNSIIPMFTLCRGILADDMHALVEHCT